MKIDKFLKNRDYALIQCEVKIVGNKYQGVEILEIQQYWEADIESLFEFDILPDVKRNPLKDGLYFCSVLIEDYEESPELDLIIIDSSFELMEEVPNLETSDALPFN